MARPLIPMTGGIPMPTASDSGKVLTVGETGKYGLAAVPSELPASAAVDEGKVLTVNSSGAPAWATPSGGGGEVFEIHLASTGVFPDPPTWEADKTPTQIYQAFAAGKTLVAIVPNVDDPPFRLTLCRIDEHLSVFYAIDDNFVAHMVRIDSDNVVVATQSIS